jgi:catechol-2,3-dioxygenase
VDDEVPGTVAAAKKELDFNIYRDNRSSFASIGDEHALLIAVKRDRKWFPARQRPAKVFPLTATIRKPTARNLEMQKFDYRISTK